MVEVSTIIGLVFTIIMIAVIGLQIYRRRYASSRPFGGFGKGYPSERRVTPEGEPLESYSPMSFSKSMMRIIIPAIMSINYCHSCFNIKCQNSRRRISRNIVNLWCSRYNKIASRRTTFCCSVRDNVVGWRSGLKRLL